MNWDHIKAVMGGWKKVATVGEQRVLTNGHIMFLVPPDSPLIDGAQEYPAAAKLWQEVSEAPIVPQEIKGLYEDRGFHCRKIGERFIAERYVRCFNEPGITWTESKEQEAIHLNGVLIAVVMPCGGSSFKVCEIPEADDSTVFSPYASDDNDWYLVNEATLRKRIEEAEDERNAAEIKRDDAEATIDECDAEISSLQLRLTRLAAEVK